MTQVKDNENTKRMAATVVEFVKKTGSKLSEDALKVLFKEHGEDIVKAALPVTVDDLAPCPPGFIRDPRTGQCVTDPGK